MCQNTRNKKFMVICCIEDGKCMYLPNTRTWDLNGFEIIGYADSLQEVKDSIDKFKKK